MFNDVFAEDVAMYLEKHESRVAAADAAATAAAGVALAKRRFHLVSPNTAESWRLYQIYKSAVEESLDAEEYYMLTFLGAVATPLSYSDLCNSFG